MPFSGAVEDLLDIVLPRFVWTPLNVRVLQDGPGLRVIVLPASKATLAPLSAGTYRLQFELSRSRWQATEPPSEFNRCARSATVSLPI